MKWSAFPCGGPPSRRALRRHAPAGQCGPALSANPEILLLDEPLSALDALTRANLQDEILRIWEQERKTVVLITNDVDEGLLMADRIIPLNPGPGATFGPEFRINPWPVRGIARR